MAFEAPVASDYNPDQFDSPAAGRYHVAVTKADEDGGNKGEMILDFEVLAGSVKDQEGKSHREYFQKTVKAMGRIHQLAIALGMITKERLKELQSRGESPFYDFEAQVNKQCFIDLQDSVYEGKTRVKADFRMYAIDDPKCATWKHNAGMLAKGGYKIAASTSTQQPPAKQPDVNLAGVL